MIKVPYFIILVFLIANVNAQNIGIGTTTPNSSAALEIKDSTRGILIPRMTIAKRNLIIAPAEGLMVYQTDSSKGYWYYDGAAWKNINAGIVGNNGGKQTLVLSDTITNTQAQLKIANEFGPNTQEIRIVGCSNLTSVDLSMVTSVIQIRISDNNVLQNVNLGNLKSCAGDFNITGCPLLTTLNISSLENILHSNYLDLPGVNIASTGLTSLNFSSLRILIGRCTIYDNSSMTSISFPLLTNLKSNSLYISNNNLLTSLNLPLLSVIGSFEIYANNSLTSLSFPSLTSFSDSTYNSSSITNCPNLISISFDNLTSFKNQGFSTQNNKLPSSQINYLLHKFVTITPNLTGRYFQFNGNVPSAPPTGVGITDKATLISRGNTVTTD